MNARTPGVEAINSITTLTMNPSVDVFVKTDRLRNDSKSRCEIQARESGGGGINIARNLHNLGVRVTAVFPAGGSNGDILEGILERSNVPCHRIGITGDTRQNLAIKEKATGSLYHLVLPGPELQDSEWQNCLKAVTAADEAPDYLILSGSLPDGVPRDMYKRAAELMARRETKVVVDTSGPALTSAVEATPYLIKLNRKEYAELGYSGEEDCESLIDGMMKMVEDGMAEVLVLTLGEKGALLASRDGDRFQAAPPPVEVVSHVGAGDAFVSIMVYQLHCGATLRESFRYGVAAAAVAVSTRDNQIENIQTVDHAYREMDDRDGGT